jgi:hypothetical protein
MNPPAYSRSESGRKTSFAVCPCPYQVEEDARLSQGRGPRFLTYLILLCIVLLCTLGFEFISEA